MTRKGNWRQTFTGKQFWPFDPRPEDIDIRDIARSLALQCRFTGHIREFYSVAEHSWLCSYYATGFELQGLLHDASEAYLGDVAKPIRPFFTGYAEAEDRIMHCIAEKFGFDWPMSAVVANADFRLLATEKRDLCAPEPASWGKLPEPYEQKIVAYSWQHIEHLFLLRFKDLAET